VAWKRARTNIFKGDVDILGDKSFGTISMICANCILYVRAEFQPGWYLNSGGGSNRDLVDSAEKGSTCRKLVYSIYRGVCPLSYG